MEKEQLYQTIEAYLDGTLEAKELAVFEQELEADVALAQEVKLHHRLQYQLGDELKMDLRVTLDAIAKEFPESDLDTDTNPPQNTPAGTGGGANGGVPFYWWGIGFALILSAGLWWYLNSLHVDQTKVIAPVTEMIGEDLGQEESADVKVEAPVENPAESKATAPQTTVPAEPAKTGRPQAYSTNKQLETLIGKEASTRYVFTDGQLSYEAQGEQSYLNFSSKLTTSRSVEEGFLLNLYTNQYPDGQVFREPLVFSEVNPDAPIAFAAKKEYIAAYAGETRLQPGLYYGVVTLSDSIIPLWVGKVKVE